MANMAAHRLLDFKQCKHKQTYSFWSPITFILCYFRLRSRTTFSVTSWKCSNISAKTFIILSTLQWKGRPIRGTLSPTHLRSTLFTSSNSIVLVIQSFHLSAPLKLEIWTLFSMFGWDRKNDRIVLKNGRQNCLVKMVFFSRVYQITFGYIPM